MNAPKEQRGEAAEILGNIQHATRRIDDAIAHNAATLATLFDEDCDESVLTVLAEALNALNCAEKSARSLVGEASKRTVPV